MMHTSKSSVFRTKLVVLVASLCFGNVHGLADKDTSQRDFLPFLTPTNSRDFLYEGSLPMPRMNQPALDILTSLLDNQITGETFMDKHFNKELLLVKGGAAQKAAFADLYDLGNEETLSELQHNFGNGRIERIPANEPGKKSIARGLDHESFLGMLDEGQSFILHYPEMRQLKKAHNNMDVATHELTSTSPPTRPLAQSALYNVTNSAESLRQAFAAKHVSANMYISGVGASALEAHTDTTDTFILQLHGQKTWRACVPLLSKQAQNELGFTDSQRDEMSSVQLCEVAETERGNTEGCSVFPRESLFQESDKNSLRCRDVITQVGDVLYMPKGVIHVARESSSDGEASAHLTIGLQREGFTFLDAYTNLLEHANLLKWEWDSQAFFNELKELSASGDQSKSLGLVKSTVPRIATHKPYRLNWRNVFLRALSRTSESTVGIPWRLMFPTWILRERCAYTSYEQRASAEFISPFCLPEADSETFGRIRARHEYLLEMLEAAVLDELQEHPQWQPSWLALEHAPRIVREIMDTLKADDAIVTLLQQVKLALEGVSESDDEYPSEYRMAMAMARQVEEDNFVKQHSENSTVVPPWEHRRLQSSGCITACNVVQHACSEVCDIMKLVPTTSCDDTCFSGCDATCFSGCDTCYGGCDSSCITGCDDSCNSCVSSCDSSCIGGCDKWGVSSCDKNCLGGCDGTCACTSGCDATCSGGCDSSCTAGCDDSCTTGCDESCSTGCDDYSDEYYDCEAACDSSNDECEATCDQIVDLYNAVAEWSEDLANQIKNAIEDFLNCIASGFSLPSASDLTALAGNCASSAANAANPVSGMIAIANAITNLGQDDGTDLLSLITSGKMSDSQCQLLWDVLDTQYPVKCFTSVLDTVNLDFLDCFTDSNWNDITVTMEMTVSVPTSFVNSISGSIGMYASADGDYGCYVALSYADEFSTEPPAPEVDMGFGLVGSPGAICGVGFDGEIGLANGLGLELTLGGTFIQDSYDCVPGPDFNQFVGFYGKGGPDLPDPSPEFSASMAYGAANMVALNIDGGAAATDDEDDGGYCCTDMNLYCQILYGMGDTWDQQEDCFCENMQNPTLCIDNRRRRLSATEHDEANYTALLHENARRRLAADESRTRHLQDGPTTNSSLIGIGEDFSGEWATGILEDAKRNVAAYKKLLRATRGPPRQAFEQGIAYLRNMSTRDDVSFSESAVDSVYDEYVAIATTARTNVRSARAKLGELKALSIGRPFVYGTESNSTAVEMARLELEIDAMTAIVESDVATAKAVIEELNEHVESWVGETKSYTDILDDKSERSADMEEDIANLRTTLSEFSAQCPTAAEDESETSATVARSCMTEREDKDKDGRLGGGQMWLVGGVIMAVILVVNIMSTVVIVKCLTKPSKSHVPDTGA